MRRNRPIMYTLAFSRAFAAPVGTTIEYVGMAKWLYRSQDTDEVTAFHDRQANSYARDTGGMKGTRWTVVKVVEEASGEFLVTIDPE
jgi:hypothetical protein